VNENPNPKVFVEVSFRVAGQSFLFDSNNVAFEQGTRVVCETEHGHAIGTVLTIAQPDQKPPANFQPLRILRAANEDDLRLEGINDRRARHAVEYCKELIIQHELPMKLVDAEYVLKGNKLLFYFSAEGRIDFRKLVRELARYFQMRIEMRQIGVRDTAKLLGGIGPCGQELCCSRFLRKFTAVSVRMAKDQNLSLNPQKITGVCGRLMCCLAYEQSTYQSARKVLPRVGAEVMTPTGKGKIRTVHALTRKAQIIFLNENPVREEEYDISQLEGFEDFHERFDKQEEIEAKKIARDAENRSHFSVEPLMESRRPGARGKQRPGPAPKAAPRHREDNEELTDKPRKQRSRRKRGKGRRPDEQEQRLPAKTDNSSSVEPVGSDNASKQEQRHEAQHEPRKKPEGREKSRKPRSKGPKSNQNKGTQKKKPQKSEQESQKSPSPPKKQGSTSANEDSLNTSAPKPATTGEKGAKSSSETPRKNKSRSRKRRRKSKKDGGQGKGSTDRKNSSKGEKN
jgi:cell fate regulator YaaT (PSP1 superfamily)